MRGTVEKGRLLGQLLHKLLPRVSISLDYVAHADHLRLLGNLEEAESLCELVIARYPEYASAHVVKGEILRDKGAMHEAEAAWREACRLHPQHPRANLHLAQLYLARGETSQAMAALHISMLGNPHSSEAQSLATQVGPRPDASWLTSDHYEELLRTVRECAYFTSVQLVDPQGVIVGGKLIPSPSGEDAAQVALTLLIESRFLLERIGAGPLRSAYLETTVKHYALCEIDGHCLLAEITAKATPDQIRHELQSTISALRRRWDMGKHVH